MRLVATKPDAKEALRQRVLDDEPIIIKGHPIRVALIRIALETIDAMKFIDDVPTLHSSSASGSSSAAHLAPAVSIDVADVIAAVSGDVAPVAVVPEAPSATQAAAISALVQKDASTRFMPQPVRDYVTCHFNSDTSKYELVHDLFGCRQTLPESEFPWELCWVEDGFGDAVELCGKDARILEISEFFPHQLYANEKGTQIVQSKTAHGVVTILLAEARAEHVGIEIDLPSTLSSATDEIGIVVWKFPRDGSRTYFSLPGLCNVIRMVRKISLARYASHQMPAWRQVVEPFQLRGFVGTVPYRREGSVATDEDLGKDVLTDEKAASIHCVVVLLSRFAYTSKQAGGVASLEEKDAAENLIKRLIELVIHGGPFAFNLFSKDVERLQCGLIVGTGGGTVTIGIDGLVHVESIEEGSAHDKGFSGFLDYFHEEFGTAGMPHILSVLAWLISTVNRRARRRHFISQFLWRIADAIDDVIIKASERPKDASLPVRPKEAKLTIASTCALYRQGIQDLFLQESLQFLSHASDKSRVHNRGLLNSIFAFPSNAVFYGTPKEHPPCFFHTDNFL